MRRRVAIPRKVTIRGRRWRVRMVRRVPPGGGPGLNRGFCSGKRRTIWIDRTEPRRRQEQTLVHEVLHAIWPDGIVDAGTEEKLILGLEPRLHAAIASGALSATTEGVG